MDFQIREWLTVIIVLLIVGVLLDGWRRMRQARRGNIKMSLSMHKGINKDDLPLYGSELPNGGARVVASRNEDEARKLARAVKESFSEKQMGKGSRPQMPEKTALSLKELNLEEEVPMLMESVSSSRASRDIVEDGIAEPIMADPLMDGFRQESLFGDDPALDAAPKSASKPKAKVEPKVEPPVEPAWAEELDDEWDEEGEWDDEEDAEEDPSQAAAEEVIVLNIMAQEGERMVGNVLLDVLLDCGMRYGDMNIFHYHQYDNGEGPILFSLANMIVPGTFQLATMDQFSTPGVSLFMTLPLPVEKTSMQAFDAMLATAKRLCEAFEAELKDEYRNVMTGQTIEHCRQRISEFERKRLSRAAV